MRRKRHDRTEPTSPPATYTLLISFYYYYYLLFNYRSPVLRNTGDFFHQYESDGKDVYPPAGRKKETWIALPIWHEKSGDTQMCIPAFYLFTYSDRRLRIHRKEELFVVFRSKNSVVNGVHRFNRIHVGKIFAHNPHAVERGLIL